MEPIVPIIKRGSQLLTPPPHLLSSFPPPKLSRNLLELLSQPIPATTEYQIDFRKFDILQKVIPMVQIEQTLLRLCWSIKKLVQLSRTHWCHKWLKYRHTYFRLYANLRSQVYAELPLPTQVMIRPLPWDTSLALCLCPPFHTACCLWLWW